MRKGAKFIAALWKTWWALMSCAAFTFLSLYVAATNRSNAWVVGAMAILAALMFVVSAYHAWAEQYEARAAAEAAIYDGRPLFVLKVIEQPSWKTQYPKAPVFELTNCGKRPARHIYLVSQRSHLKNYTLSFAQIPLLSPDCTETLAYEVDQHGADQRALSEFIRNNPQDSALVWWDIEIAFRDSSDVRGTDTIRLCFDVESQVLYTAAVPYTEKKITPQPRS